MHSNQLLYNGKVSMFSYEDCTFGTSSVDQDWNEYMVLNCIVDTRVYYYGENQLLSQRRETLIANPNVDRFADTNPWNDYGGLDYVGSVDGIQPLSISNTPLRLTDWLDFIAYYTARRRPTHLSSETAGTVLTSQTQDRLWEVVQLTLLRRMSDARMPAGTIKLKLLLAPDCAVSSAVARGAGSTISA
ncbi:uncharacterized protein PHACADRAFT_197602 [Phanerochaete carnosa HHB-10118-sp]|uniref:Uncharacterized protein n=1 Tax=Phanerochaete carnosa (strain HHB-10118-sp) TaxID=650164 RepID=K5VNY2_PHACS|nr:uncharacterized protein PHACADRAFT_197602 [Phanerochaete carnosa HHB-10118-sp]EKM53183.1 hypothetical protein PHACADRAFT_197602 [Phanerochaete carnosa HHB-10118-sp]